MSAERVPHPPQHESSSFPSFASLPVNVVRGILTAITAAGLGMGPVEDAHPCKAQLMTGSESSWSGFFSCGL